MKMAAKTGGDMSDPDKRAALFEYFKTVNSPKWANDGARLHKVLSETPNAKIDQMYARMIQLQAREQLIKKQKETPMYKRWKIPLMFFFVWGGAAVYFAHSAKPDLISCMFYAFIAGSYFEEFIQNGTYNLVEYKYKRQNEDVNRP